MENEDITHKNLVNKVKLPNEAVCFVFKQTASFTQLIIKPLLHIHGYSLIKHKQNTRF